MRNFNIRKMDEKYVLKGKITVKGTTQVSGLYLK
jgi:hypothetical protein